MSERDRFERTNVDNGETFMVSKSQTRTAKFEGGSWPAKAINELMRSHDDDQERKVRCRKIVNVEWIKGEMASVRFICDNLLFFSI